MVVPAVRENGAPLNGVRITLPGNTGGNLLDASTSASMNLSNGIVSSKTRLTVEIWATPITFRQWQLNVPPIETETPEEPEMLPFTSRFPPVTVVAPV